jgi:hypothetical protein
VPPKIPQAQYPNAAVPASAVTFNREEKKKKKKKKKKSYSGLVEYPQKGHGLCHSPRPH